jgi:hypothetical protein
VVNREFERKIFGSVPNAMGRYFKMPDGRRVQVVGIVEDGKYNRLTEDPQPAVFFPILQSPSSQTYLVVRSDRDPLQLAADIRSKLRDLDRGLPVYIQTRHKAMDADLFPSRVASSSLGVLGVMAAMLAITGIFGMAAYSVSKRLKELGIRIALARTAQKCCNLRWGGLFGYMPMDQVGGSCWGLRPPGYCRPSFIRELRAILWSWLASFWLCHCWAC